MVSPVQLAAGRRSITRWGTLKYVVHTIFCDVLRPDAVLLNSLPIKLHRRVREKYTHCDDLFHRAVSHIFSQFQIMHIDFLL